MIAADIAPGMLETTRRLAAERGLDNVLVQYADAAALPFANASFDLVTCRIAPHHFADVPEFLAEVTRVLAPAGRFVLEDSLADAAIKNCASMISCLRLWRSIMTPTMGPASTKVKLDTTNIWPTVATSLLMTRVVHPMQTR